MQIIIKQQDTIASLDAELMASFREIETLRSNATILIQEKSTIQDQLGLNILNYHISLVKKIIFILLKCIGACKIQLKNALQAYDTDVRRLQPIIEEYIQQSHLEQRQINDLRHDFGMTCAKIIHSERVKNDALKELDGAKEELVSVAGTQVCVCLYRILF